MTNKERYKRAFSALHASEETKEAIIMQNGNNTVLEPVKSKKRLSKAAIVALAAALLLALATVGFAADVGGIQRTVQIWIHGDRTDAVLDLQDGSYTLQYKDAEGKTRQREGGGVAYDIFGRERPLTEDEIMEELNSPEVELTVDGAVWVYYRDQAMEITDKFDADGVCYVKLKDGSHALYMTVTLDGEGGIGYSTSKHRFPSAKGLE